jgi:WD40 repeat protein/tRNA A-37 threonylcarbamoyl transferase component Bud32
VVTTPPPEIPGYEILGVIGHGGMAVVYEALQISLKREVAIKLMDSDLAKQPDFVARFEREATALAALNHPNVVAVHDRGEAEGHLYFVMEYVPGYSLREVLEEVGGCLDRNSAVHIMTQVAEGLRFVHERGTIHRDVKPENILITKEGRAKISDFGLAGMVDRSLEARLTRENVVMGTVDYMAPEQRENTRGVDHRADLYSYGVMFYELLTGHLPQGAWKPASRYAAGLDPSLDQIILDCLERHPEDRIASAEKILDVLHTIEAQAWDPDSQERAAQLARDAGELRLSGATVAGRAPPVKTVAAPAAPGAVVEDLDSMDSGDSLDEALARLASRDQPTLVLDESLEGFLAPTEEREPLPARILPNFLAVLLALGFGGYLAFHSGGGTPAVLDLPPPSFSPLTPTRLHLSTKAPLVVPLSEPLPIPRESLLVLSTPTPPPSLTPISTPPPPQAPPSGPDLLPVRKPPMGGLEVVGLPPGARVRLVALERPEQEVHLVKPGAILEDLPVGRYRLEVEAPDYQPFRGEIPVRKGVVLFYPLSLQRVPAPKPSTPGPKIVKVRSVTPSPPRPPPKEKVPARPTSAPPPTPTPSAWPVSPRGMARLTVRSTPSRAQVFLRGRPVGKTPMILLSARPGSGQVEVKLRNYVAWRQSVTLREEAPTILDVRLRRLWEAGGIERFRLAGHGKPVTSLSRVDRYSRIASGGRDNSVRIWDIVRGKPLQVLEGHAGDVLSLAYDNGLLASSGKDQKVRLWSIPGGSLLKAITVFRQISLSLDFSPDGKYLLAGSQDRTCKLYGLGTGRLEKRFRGHRGWVGAVTFLPRDQGFASGSRDGSVRIWDLEGRHSRLTLTGHPGAVHCLGASSDGHLLASGGEQGEVFFWNPRSGKLRGEIKGHGSPLRTLAFSPERSLLAGGDDAGIIYLWEVSGRRLLCTLQAGGGAVRALIFLKRDLLISGGDDGLVRVWQAREQASGSSRE